MIQAAINKGLERICITDHMDKDYFAEGKEFIFDVDKYYETLLRLKGKYADRIRLFAGFEIDMYASPDVSGLDYTIGSSHFLRFGAEFVEFDKKASIFQEILNQYFDEDI